MAANQVVFDRADIIDRNPPAEGAYTTITGVGTFLISGATASLSVTRRRYPSAPTIRVSADVEMLWGRYSLYKEGRDFITAMGYSCFSHLLLLANGAAAASRMFAVDDKVLDNLSRLTSGVGDKATARKRHRRME